LPKIEHMNRRPGRLTLACRFICSSLIAGVLLYWNGIEDGDAYHFLALVLLAPIAGFVLIANSLFCLFRDRTWTAATIALIFISVGVAGFLEVMYFGPQFRM